MNKTALCVDDLDLIKNDAVHAVRESRARSALRYVDARVSIGEGVGAYSEDGNPKVTSSDWSFSLGIRVIAGSRMLAGGFYGKQLGLHDIGNFGRVLDDAIDIAYLRAKTNAQHKSHFKKLYGKFGRSIVSTELAPIEVHESIVSAQYSLDPTKITPQQMTAIACHAASTAKNFHRFVRKVELVVNTGISRQLFISSQGATIDQWTASTGGTVFILAQNDQGDTPVDLYHHTGNQLGLEALTEGKNAHGKTIDQFAAQIAQESVTLADAKPAPLEEKPVPVILDPDLVALFAHEIIGHPSELDRALKMETGYAGRSWFLSDLHDHMVGKQVGSTLLTAFSDPTLQGAYGYYLFDDEGTPARRVYHIKNGIYQDFMNSRQTAALWGSQPNGHYKANDAAVVPLIRMSASAIAPGMSDPAHMIEEVEDGYYCVGHRIPSISESRENFQIAPRLMYKIRHGRIGEVYRDGRITGDSKDFFMAIDAVGDDFKIFPIPNCGKGQPMQTKQVGNGGPTARSRAMIARGE